MIFSWFRGGLLLGLVFFASVLLVKPVGVSTEFSVAAGWLWSLFDADGMARNAYFAAGGGKLAKAVTNPLNYGVVFVSCMVLGAFLSGRLRGGVPLVERSMPHLWRVNFGDSHFKRYAAVFFAGVVVLFGARLAGGCTSGHMMSGMMQTALSGYVFALGAFGVGIPVALMLYKKEQ